MMTQPTSGNPAGIVIGSIAHLARAIGGTAWLLSTALGHLAVAGARMLWSFLTAIGRAIHRVAVAVGREILLFVRWLRKTITRGYLNAVLLLANLLYLLLSLSLITLPLAGWLVFRNVNYLYGALSGLLVTAIAVVLYLPELRNVRTSFKTPRVLIVASHALLIGFMAYGLARNYVLPAVRRLAWADAGLRGPGPIGGSHDGLRGHAPDSRRPANGLRRHAETPSWRQADDAGPGIGVSQVRRHGADSHQAPEDSARRQTERRRLGAYDRGRTGTDAERVLHAPVRAKAKGGSGRGGGLHENTSLGGMLPPYQTRDEAVHELH